MGSYTEVLDVMSQDGLDEDNYIEELLKITSTFRRFDEALDLFLFEHGYEEDITDIDAKVKFIKQAYKNNDVELPRDIKKWYTEHKIIKKKTAFTICFAFGLDVVETEDFMRRILLERGFDCHNIEECVFYYCISRGYTYRHARQLIERIGTVKKDMKVDGGQELLYTSVILDEIQKFTSDDELIQYVEGKKEQFRYNNVKAYECIHMLWSKINDKNGLAYKEKTHLYKTFDDNFTITQSKGQDREEKVDSEWAIYMQIFGLAGEFSNKCFSDRNLKPILKDNALIHPLAEHAFPDRDGLNKVLNGVHKDMSNDRIRKILVLLLFYRYWCEMALRKKSYEAACGDGERCLSQINSTMIDAGYPTLYAGNPYDWIFLLAIYDNYPLRAFRDYMQELFYLKEDEIKVVE